MFGQGPDVISAPSRFLPGISRSKSLFSTFGFFFPFPQIRSEWGLMTVPGAGPLGTKPPSSEEANDNPGPHGPGQEARAQTAPWNPCGLGTAALRERTGIWIYVNFSQVASFSPQLHLFASDLIFLKKIFWSLLMSFLRLKIARQGREKKAEAGTRR